MTDLHKDIYYINRILKGETSCYTYLVDKYSKRVFSYIFKITHNREDAEEICQDVFVKAFRALSSFKKESSFSTWIYTIAYNTTISAGRRKKREFLFIDESQIANITEEDVVMTFGQSSSEEQLVSLETALQELPPEERGLILLFYIKEKSINDIAQITGFTTSNVKTKLHRIRKKIYYLLSNKTQNYG